MTLIYAGNADIPESTRRYVAMLQLQKKIATDAYNS
jgi:hypothetical protein